SDGALLAWKQTVVNVGRPRGPATDAAGPRASAQSEMGKKAGWPPNESSLIPWSLAPTCWSALPQGAKNPKVAVPKDVETAVTVRSPPPQGDGKTVITPPTLLPSLSTLAELRP